MLTMPLNLEAIKKEIVEQLKPLDPEKVILFGSYAYGQPTEESDIDLYIVTKDDFIPQSYQEKRELVRRISRHIHALRQAVCIDLLVQCGVFPDISMLSDKKFVLIFLSTRMPCIINSQSLTVDLLVIC